MRLKSTVCILSQKSTEQNECSMFTCWTQLQLIPPPLQPSIKCTLWIWEEGTRESEKGFCFSSVTTVKGRAEPSNSPSNGPKNASPHQRAGRGSSISGWRSHFHLSTHTPHLGHIWHHVRSRRPLVESTPGRNSKAASPSWSSSQP